MERKERQLVNHNVLAIGAVISILLLVMMFNAFFDSRAQNQGAAQQSLGQKSGAMTDFDTPSSLKVPVDTGIYYCRSGDMAECSDFCNQVHLLPKRCMIKLNDKSLDSSLCACEAPE